MRLLGSVQGKFGVPSPVFPAVENILQDLDTAASNKINLLQVCSCHGSRGKKGNEGPANQKPVYEYFDLTSSIKTSLPTVAGMT